MLLRACRGTDSQKLREVKPGIIAPRMFASPIRDRGSCCCVHLSEATHHSLDGCRVCKIDDCPGIIASHRVTHDSASRHNGGLPECGCMQENPTRTRKFLVGTHHGIGGGKPM